MLKTGFQGRRHLITVTLSVRHLKARCIEDNPWPFSSFGKKNWVNVLMSFVKDYVSKACNNRIITRGATFKSEN